MSKKNIQEFASTDQQSHVPDPISTGNHNRPADKMDRAAGGETYETTTKAESMAKLMAMAGQLGKEELNDIFTQVAAALGGSSARSADKTTGEIGILAISPSAAPTNGNVYKPAGAVHSVPGGKGEIGQVRLSPTAVMAEDMEELFAGDDLSEEFKTKASVIFEAAINTRLAVEIARLEEEAEAVLVEEIENIREELVTNVDKYLSYAAEEWVKENHVAIRSTLKTEIAEDFIHGLKALFEDNYIDLPEIEINVVSELESEIASLKEELSNKIEDIIELNEQLSAYDASEILSEMTHGLTYNQAEKLKILAENIHYDSVEEFQSKVEILRESYFGNRNVNIITETLNEEFETDNAKVTGPMADYVAAISRTVKK